MKLKTISGGICISTLAMMLAGCAHDPARAAAELLSEARAYAQKNQYKSAIIEVRRALQLQPNSAAAYLELAKIEMQQQQWPAAYAALNQVLDLDPGQIEARLDVARIKLASHDLAGATAAAAEVLKRQPNNAAAWQVEAAVDADNGHPAEAEKKFARITQLTPKDPDAWINLALADASLRRPDAAEADLRKAIAVAPQTPLAYADLAHLDQLRGRTAAARADVRQGLAANPDSVKLWLAQAAMDYDPRHPQAAQSDLKTLLARTHQSAPAALGVANFDRGHGDSAAAEQVIVAAAALHPHSVALQQQVLAADLRAGRLDAAEQVDAAILQQDPANPDALVTHARLLLARGKTKDAIGILEPLASSHPGSYPVLYALGLAYWRAGRTRPALHQEELALAARPGSAECLHVLAELQLANGNPAAAAPYAQKYLDATNHGPDGYRTVGQVDVAAKQFKPALSALRAGKLDSSTDVSDRVLVAQAAEGAGQPALARRELIAAARQQPHSSEIAGMMLHLDAGLGHWPQAEQDVAIFTAANPHDANAPWLRATLELARGDNAAARADLNRALAIKPDFLEAKLDLGRAWQDGGSWQQSVHWYEQAAQQEPGFAPLLTLIGNLYLQNGQPQPAAQYYRRALSAKPDFALAQANLAWVDAHQGQNLSEALKLAQSADRSMAGTPSVDDTLAWVYYKLGSYGSALPILRRCVAAAPRNALYRYQLGMTLIANGDKASGRVQLRQALALKLPAEQARQAQRQLADDAA